MTSSQTPDLMLPRKVRAVGSALGTGAMRTSKGSAMGGSTLYLDSQKNTGRRKQSQAGGRGDDQKVISTSKGRPALENQLPTDSSNRVYSYIQKESPSPNFYPIQEHNEARRGSSNHDMEAQFNIASARKPGIWNNKDQTLD